MKNKWENPEDKNPSPEFQKYKETIVKELAITKSPTLYKARELRTYKDYDVFVKQQKEDRRDRHMNMRVDDIEGAQNRKFFRGR